MRSSHRFVAGWLCGAVLLILLSSCGYKDIDKRYFVVGIAIDQNPDDNKDSKNSPSYTVNFKLAVASNPDMAQDEAKASLLIEQKADSMTEAVRLVKAHVDRELDFTQTKAIIFGKTLVQEGRMLPVLDWFMRRRDIQRIAWVGVGEPDAKAVLELKPDSESTAEMNLFHQFGEGTESSYIVPVPLFVVYKRMQQRGIDLVLPRIEVRERDKLLFIDRAYLFDKKKPVALLTTDETKMYNVLANKANKLELWTRSNDAKHFALSISKSKTRFKIKQQQHSEDEFVFLFKLKLKANVEEMLGLQKVKQNNIQRVASKQLKKDALAFLQKCQQLNVDPLGIGMRHRSTHVGIEHWEDWKEHYRNATFKVKVDLTITSSGTITE